MSEICNGEDLNRPGSKSYHKNNSSIKSTSFSDLFFIDFEFVSVKIFRKTFFNLFFILVHERLDLITEKYETLANSMTGSTEKPEKLYLEKLEKVDGHSSEGADNANVSSKGVKKPCKSMDHALVSLFLP